MTRPNLTCMKDNIITASFDTVYQANPLNNLCMPASSVFLEAAGLVLQHPQHFMTFDERKTNMSHLNQGIDMTYNPPGTQTSTGLDPGRDYHAAELLTTQTSL